MKDTVQQVLYVLMFWTSGVCRYSTFNSCRKFYSAQHSHISSEFNFALLAGAPAGPKLDQYLLKHPKKTVFSFCVQISFWCVWQQKESKMCRVQKITAKITAFRLFWAISAFRHFGLLGIVHWTNSNAALVQVQRFAVSAFLFFRKTQHLTPNSTSGKIVEMQSFKNLVNAFHISAFCILIIWWLQLLIDGRHFNWN